MSTNKKSAQVATYGVFFAVVFIAFNIDSLLSMVLPIKFAIVTISTVAVLILLSKNVWEALLVGVFFGLSSLISQFYLPKVPEFLNPLCSVLPRACVGMSVFGVFRLMRRLTDKTVRDPLLAEGLSDSELKRNRKRSEMISASIAGATAAIVNTALVMLMLSIYRTSPYLDMIKGVLLLNFLPECAGAIILVPFISTAVSKASRRPLGGIPVIRVSFAAKSSSAN